MKISRAFILFFFRDDVYNVIFLMNETIVLQLFPLDLSRSATSLSRFE